MESNRRKSPEPMLAGTDNFACRTTALFQRCSVAVRTRSSQWTSGGFCRPVGTFPFFLAIPAVETAGYCRVFLRNKALVRAKALLDFVLFGAGESAVAA